MPERESTTGQPLQRLAAAERGRRRLVVRGLAGAFALLSGMVLVLYFLVPMPSPVAVVNAAAGAGFAAAFVLARGPRDPAPAAITLLVVMQLQHLGSALALGNPPQMGATIMFSGLLPLIAGATLSVRAVGVWIALPLVVAGVAFGSGMAQGFDPTTLGQYLGAPIFFITVAGAASLLTAMAASRSMATQVQREEALQHMTAELEATRRMDALGRLAGGVAHDFNNMLSVIGSCASMVRDALDDDHPAREDLVLIDDAVDRAAKLTGQLLAFARRQVTPTGQAAPGRTLRELAPLLRRALGANVKLDIDAEGSSWKAALDAGQLEQILTNLAINARDAMPGGGTLGIRVRDERLDADQVPHLRAGPYVCVAVQDTGDGMSPEVRARVFEPFFTTKGDGEGDDGGKGTGLGLSSCYGIARQAGGNLTVESAPRAGTTFRLYLPRATGEPPKPQPEASAGPSTLDGRRVLVVDDERALREPLAALLRRRGAQVETAANLAQALDAVEQGHFDAIVSDVVLGSEDGLEVLERMRALQPKARLVAMSGYTPAPRRLAALCDTGIGFLAKPFSEQQLLDTLSS